MVTSKVFRILLVVTGVLATCLASVALASEREGDAHRVVIISDDDTIATVTVRDGKLTVTTSDEDGETVSEVDLDEIGRLVGDAVATAMNGVSQALDALSDTDITIAVGDDDHVVAQIDGEETARDLRREARRLRSEMADLREKMRELQEQLRDADEH